MVSKGGQLAISKQVLLRSKPKMFCRGKVINLRAWVSVCEYFLEKVRSE